MPPSVFYLPNGKACGVRKYCEAWRSLKAMSPVSLVRGWGNFAEQASDILREMRYGVHDRINKHDPAYGKGRKWRPEWQIETRRLADGVNHPRLVLHWIPAEFRERFAHRLWQPD